jgi:xanthine/CO dehydrogenase XdhC/CoxF family maturation factor
VNRPEDVPLYEALISGARSGRRLALATIVGTKGSTPRKVGTKMLVDPETGLVGTVGGGCGEGEVLEAARRVIESGLPVTVLVDLTKELMSWSPAVCGGTMEVFVEPVERLGD